MTSSEKTLLSTFLLPRSSLSSFLTLSQFTELFPRSYREPQRHPHIEVLYHELQHQRALALDRVAENIDEECFRSEKLRREISLRKHMSRRENAVGMKGGGGEQREMEMEVALYGPTSSFADTPPHTLQSVIQEMEHACVDLEEEVAELNEQSGKILQELRRRVADLDQLKTAREKDVDEKTKRVVEGTLNDLTSLEMACME